MGVLKPGEQLVDSVKDYRSGTIGFSGVNDAYDLYLAKLSSGNYILIVFMKIQFFFDDGEDSKGKTLSWTPFEKNDFVKGWTEAVQGAWGRRTIKTLASGKTVGIDFRFETKIGGWMFDHWELSVKKVEAGVFNVSSVNCVSGNSDLDSEDLKFAVKYNDPRTRTIHRQRGVVHEFGHMLGLDDEYEKDSPHYNDLASVMRSGEAIRERHDAVYVKWLDKKLVEKKIA